MAPDGLWRVLIGLGLWCILLAAEWRMPARRIQLPWRRYAANLGLGALSIVCLRVLPFLSVISAARWGEDIGFGLLHWLSLPIWADHLLGLALFDLAIYGQHVAFHRINFLWRFHQVHHGDIQLDTSTAYRFHPGEALLSMIYKMAVVIVLGLSPEIALLAEIMLNAAALFGHANVAIAPKWDGFLRLGFVTPAMHLTHHDLEPSSQRRNFATTLSIWDRLFGTYRASNPAQLGLEHVARSQSWTALYLLMSPFARR
jgi:sterol desaturase/sphingolipid hydroxylase (fatty acid hydroxylase superfamily)